MWYRYKVTTGAYTNSWTNVTSDDNVTGNIAFNYTNLSLAGDNGSGGFALSNDYNVQFAVMDKFSCVVCEFTVPKAIPLASLLNQKIGINNPNPTQALDVAGNGAFSGSISSNGSNVVTEDLDVGFSKEWNTDICPPGYLFENGQAVSRTVYARLFNCIGTIFGAGDGSTTFNLPDSRGRTSVGSYDSGGALPASYQNTIGGYGGYSDVTLTVAQLAEHGHTDWTGPAGNHGHNFPGGHTWSWGDNGLANELVVGNTSVYAGGNPPSNNLTSSQNYWTGVNWGGSHSHTIPHDGGGQSHSNMSPYVIKRKVIKF
jgi:microcystin-dependent protein